MRRTCPYLLGALLVALLCLGGGPNRLDQLLLPVTARLSGWLAPASSAQAAASLGLTSRELAPVAAALYLALAPLFHRWSPIRGHLGIVAWTGLVLMGGAAASGLAGAVLPTGALLIAGLTAFGAGTLARLAAVDGDRRDGRHHGVDAALMPALIENSTAAILTFDVEGRIRSCNRATGRCVP